MVVGLERIPRRLKGPRRQRRGDLRDGRLDDFEPRLRRHVVARELPPDARIAAACASADGGGVGAGGVVGAVAAESEPAARRKASETDFMGGF